MHIRRAKKEDLSRIAEILVYNNRVNYFPIFGSEEYSFKELQVLPLAEEYEKRLPACLVYDDRDPPGLYRDGGSRSKKIVYGCFFSGPGRGRGPAGIRRQRAGRPLSLGAGEEFRSHPLLRKAGVFPQRRSDPGGGHSGIPNPARTEITAKLLCSPTVQNKRPV